MDLLNKNILVIGAATTGIPVVSFLLENGANVVINDKRSNAELEEVFKEIKNANIKIVGGGHPLTLLNDCELIIVSPGIPLDIEIMVNAKAKNIKVISEIELAYRFTNAPIVAITGTNGKTTTTALLGEIVKNANKTAYVTGNIGNPMIKYVANASENDVFVLELSSFQLETVDEFHPHISAILNITPDHLNRHKTVENYIMAKTNIFKNQTKDDFLILNKDDIITASLGKNTATNILFFSTKEEVLQGAYVSQGIIYTILNGKREEIIKINKIFIPGSHNVENALAATLMAKCLGINNEVIARTLEEFRGVEHRIEYVNEIDGVIYYNDSKGTNPDASIKAIEAMTRPIVLLAGGMDKGSEFDGFVASFKDKVRDIVLIGETMDKIEKEIEKYSKYNVYKYKSFEDAVHKCMNIAKPGDCVLLSPACASWDMFESYEKRGELFKAIINN